MLSKLDLERLVSAQQSVDLAQQSLSDLCKAENALLAEHALASMEDIVFLNKKLQKLITITQNTTSQSHS
jgi:hypothetical protein